MKARISMADLVVLVISGAIWAATGAASEGLRLPQSPIQPTAEDCHQLHLAFTELFQNAASRTQACLQGPAHIGPGEQVVSSTCALSATTRAWPQCVSYEQASCVIHKTRMAELDTCMSRVRASAQQQSLMGQVNDTVQTSVSLFENSRSLLSDPKAFLKQAGAQAVLDAVFPEGSPARFDIANDVLSYAHGFASAGLQSTRSPLVRGIQQEALDQVAGLLTETLGQLDVAIAGIRSVRVESDRRWRQTLPPQAPVPTPPSRRATGGGPDCAYNQERLGMYLGACAGYDGCANRPAMEALVAQSCE
jgi:hypothetical protein